MEIVFFIYGLAFFLLGFAILLYPRKGSSYELSKYIKYVAFFGILHGINEWLDFFILIGRVTDTLRLDIVRLSTLPASFIFLVHFGSKVLGSRPSSSKVFRYLTIIMGLIWATLFFCGHRTMVMWDVWSRYILCIPGAFLTGLGLLLYVPSVEPARVRSVTRNLKFAGVAFIVYAFLAGAIVPEAFFFPASVLNYDAFKDLIGMPVQVLRSLCAIVMAYSLICALKMFDLEIRRDLYESQLRFSTVAKQAPVLLFTTDKDLKVTFIEGKGLESLRLAGKEQLGQSITRVFAESDGVADCCRTALSRKDCACTINVNESVLNLFSAPLMDRKKS